MRNVSSISLDRISGAFAMQKFNDAFRAYLLIVAAPLVIVSAGIGCSLLAMGYVARIERASGMPTPFDLCLPSFGHARFFLVTLAAQLVISGCIVAKSALASMRFGGRSLELHPPLARVTAIQLVCVGACVLSFYAARALIIAVDSGVPF